MTSNYNTEHFIEQIINRGYTNFLNPYELEKLKYKISIKKYNIYKPYEDCTKKIIYSKNKPSIVLLKLILKEPTRHQEILKNFFMLGLKEDSYGDIIVKEKEVYIYTFPNIKDYIILNVTNYNKKIKNVIEVPLSSLENYQPSYDNIELMVSSLRIDNIISTLIKTNRKDVLSKFKNKEILLNYQVITKYTTKLKEKDVFSIRKYGKFYFDQVLRTTKKGSLIINIKKSR